MKKAPKTFEEGLSRLQEILSRMQAQDTPLAESVKLYAEAADLIQYCNQTLNTAKLQIDEIDDKLQQAVQDTEDLL
mgnify:FL=1